MTPSQKNEKALAALKELAESSEATNDHLLRIGTDDEWEAIWNRWRAATKEAIAALSEPETVETSKT